MQFSDILGYKLIFAFYIGCTIQCTSSDRPKLATIYGVTECKWSFCEGLTHRGTTICEKFGEEWGYTGDTFGRDCGWDTNRVQCCRIIKPECKMMFNCANYERCVQDYDKDWRIVGKNFSCGKTVMREEEEWFFECCQVFTEYFPKDYANEQKRKRERKEELEREKNKQH